MTYVLATLLLGLTLIGMAGAVIAARWRVGARLVMGRGEPGASSAIDAALRAVARDLAAVVRRRPGGRGHRDALRGSWTRVLDLMRLGQAPGLRRCQHCGGVDVVTARRCLYCSRPPSPDLS